MIPLLAERFTVSHRPAGHRRSVIPGDGLDMKSAAIRMHDLVQSLGVQHAEVVGHDIGLMVAYAYAAQFPAEATKLVLMNHPCPGSPGGRPPRTAPTSGIFASTGRLLKHLWKVANEPTSSISGRPC